MDGSIFPVATLDRDAMPWDDYLSVLTPVQEHDGLLYKREDWFAPLGYGGINGMKLRQCTWLIGQAVEKGAQGIITGASVLSPQVSMSALVAAHYDLPCSVVLGATSDESAGKHENVAIAQEVGAELLHTAVAYNPALQRAVIEAAEARPGWYRLRYGISPAEDATPNEIEAFHSVGAFQVGNLPEVERLVMPAGSCMSCVSVLYGLAISAPKALRTVTLLGVGPTRLQFIEDRLQLLAEVSGLDVPGLYRRRYHHHAELEHEHQTDGPVLLEHFDLHSTGYATYQDRMPWSQDGISFHPTYEGKTLRYLIEGPGLGHAPLVRDGKTLFWIVGSAPSRAAMLDTLILEGPWPRSRAAL